MRLIPLVCAALLALGATVTHAEDTTTTVTLLPALGTPGSFSAAFGTTHSFAGAFTDTFTFTGAVGGLVSASLVTIGFQASDNIDLSSVTLNGLALSLTGTGGLGIEVASLPTSAVTGPLTLVVTGVAAPSLAVGSAIAASLGGTLNVSTPVPEPETYALLLAGLGVVTLLSRRYTRG